MLCPVHLLEATTSTLVTWWVPLQTANDLSQFADTTQKGSLESGRQGWSGISHGGGMPNSLLLVAWPEKNDVKTKFVYAG
jgi:hypothetical protein